jgi:uncharacterized protein YjbJ (UPF0337 family)
MVTPYRQSCSGGNRPHQPTEQNLMNKDIIAGKWTQMKGKLKEKWGDLTDDDVDVAEGNAQYLAGKLQERYGWAKDRAEQEIKDFSDRWDKDNT